jgi:putative hemolysin
MEPPLNPYFQILSIFNESLSSADMPSILFCLLSTVFFIGCAGLFSGSENALFSLSKLQIEELTETETKTAKSLKFLLNNPKSLLATILVANTFVTVCTVMVSTILFHTLFDFEANPIFGFVFEVVLVTFLIVLIGEVIPKIYSVQNNIKVAGFVAIPMYSIYRFLKPLIYVLIHSTSIIDKRVTKRGHILSMDELSHAIDITSEKDAPKQEKNILKSIVNFGNTSVTQIMRQRPDIIAVNANTSFTDLMQIINEWGYSRMPVYEGSLDNVTGVLSTKDLLPHLDKPEDFNWKTLLRKPFFVPESKMIDDLLKDFQNKRVHLALVADEFGGISGLVTMEDVLEEVFGEINDEYDEEENDYQRIDKNNYMFEAKVSIKDMCRYMEIDEEVFEDVRKEAETLGGMLLELNGNLPFRGQTIKFDAYSFKIEAVDKRKIKRVKVSIDNELEA